MRGFKEGFNRFYMMRNSAKIEILTWMSDGSEYTSTDIAELTNRTIENASTLLKNYQRWGLLRRYWDGHCYYYTITERGQERLDFLLKV
jgi:hypothetical protein